MNHQKKQGGFSLVELIVAIAIMAIIVLPLLRAFMVSAKTNASAKKQLVATEEAQNIMETIEVTSLDELLTYFNSTTVAAEDIKFSESVRTRLAQKSDGTYAAFASKDKSTDGNYYFGLKDVKVNGFEMDVLLQIEANKDTNGNGVVLNDQNVTKVTAISSDNDAICTISQTPADIQGLIGLDSLTGVTRNIEVTIGTVTDSDPSIGVYTQVKTNQSYTWAGGSYPATSTDTDFLDVVFDNSDDKSRQLNNIYLFYYPWYTSTLGNLTDYITINNTTGQAVNVFIIKQTESIPEEAKTSYQLKDRNYRVKVNVVENVPVSATKASTKLRTNFKENIYGGTATTNPVIALNGNTLNADKISSDTLTAEGADDRLFNVTVTAYPSGAYPYFKEKTIFKSVTGGMVN
jgi:prepilin-type N-terminal cleavage/methylation domain-containing protein